MTENKIPTLGRFPLLDGLKSPADLRDMNPSQLEEVARELRDETIDVVSSTGGHFGSALGVIELTVALHAVFDTPDDRIVWDVGHQTYPHKILTGRRDRIRTLRQPGGLSGFTKRCESEYDPFGAGHSSTSISAGLGMTVGRHLKATRKEERNPHNVVAVIGDGSISAGMAFEAMNNAGSLGEKADNLIVILNDNEMSIAPPVGAMSNYLSRLISSRPYFTLRDLAQKITRRLPPRLERSAKKVEEYARGMLVGGGTLFEEMGFYYVGPVDGHDMKTLVPILRNLKQANHGPILLHVVTQKGHGYDAAENADDKYHAVARFDVETGVQSEPTPKNPAYTSVFSKELLKLAEKDDAVTAITAAMPGGTGLTPFAERFPTRFFDVGIAEQHAVTFAAGLATEGLKPFCAIYSTFLQRAFDQVMHDVALQNLPVRFAVDRAGLVGADGATHAGSFDLNYLCCLPNMVVMAPSDEAELARMTHTAWAHDAGPIAFRFPRGAGNGAPVPENPEILPIGKGRIIFGENAKNGVAILSLGTRLGCALEAAQDLAKKGIDVTVADARFAKPIDGDLADDLAKRHKVLLTIEEGAVGGFGAQVMHHLAANGLLDDVKFRPLAFPDKFIDHNDQAAQYAEAGLTSANMARVAREALKK